MNQPASDASAWDRYWVHGNLHSFSQVTTGNYGGPIGDFWERRFEALGDDQCVVDIATGNGAVALLALDAADRAGRRVRVHGTDLADIDPAHRLTEPALRERAARVCFHPRTPAESLPFESASVDLACSQFGLEYSDTGRSLPEIARVVRAGGGLALVVHHARSGAVEAARDEAAQLAFVLDEVRLYARARHLLRALAEVRPAPRSPRARLPAKAARKRDALDRAVARVRTAAAGRTEATAMRGALNYVEEVLAMIERIGAARALDWLDEARRRMTAMHERLAAMQRAALDESGAQALARGLEEQGFERPSIDTLVEAERRVLGWTLEARRR